MNRLNYFVGGEIVTVSHLDKVCYILGYLPKENRIYLGDKEMNVLSYALLLSVMEYQTCVMRQDFTAADQILPTIPKEHRNRVAHFLEKQGFKKQALAVTTDPEHQFDLALQLGELEKVVEIATEIDSVEKWRSVADLATQKCELKLASEALRKAKDHGGLLLLATSSGDKAAVQNLAEDAEKEGKFNVAFLSNMLTGNLDACLNLLLSANRLPEAAMFCRSYLPSKTAEVTAQWKGTLTGKKAESIASPEKYPNLFDQYEESLTAEAFYKSTAVPQLASDYAEVEPITERDLIEESIGFEVDDTEVEPEVQESPVVPEVAAAPVPEPEVEPEVEPEAEPEPEPAAAPAAEPAAPVAQTEGDSGSNPTSQPELISESEVADLEAELDNLEVDSVPEDDDDES